MESDLAGHFEPQSDVKFDGATVRRGDMEPGESLGALARAVGQTGPQPAVECQTPQRVTEGDGISRRDQQALDAQRTRIDRLIGTASTALSAHVAPPPLPS